MARIKKLQRIEPIIIEAYTQYNRTLKELATFHNVAVGTIQNILRRNSIPARPQGRKRIDQKDIEKYKEELAKLQNADNSGQISN